MSVFRHENCQRNRNRIRSSISITTPKLNDMIRTISLIGCLLLGVTALSAQSFSGGFKAGLNFSTLTGGELETDNSNSEVEEFGFNTGFHIGAAFNLNLTDNFGFRAEFLFNQKGTDYSFDGPSYWIFGPATSNPVIGVGTRVTDLKVSNTYLDLPLMAYVKLGRVELSGGVNAAVMISSRGTGESTFNGQTLNGSTIGLFTVNLNHNYFSDAAGEAKSDIMEQVSIGGSQIEIPSSIGAYYFRPEGDNNLFDRLDFGLVAGVGFFLNRGLYLGFRANWGIPDVTETAADISNVRLDTQQTFVTRDDKDKNLSLQASIGFSF